MDDLHTVDLGSKISSLIQTSNALQDCQEMDACAVVCRVGELYNRVLGVRHPGRRAGRREVLITADLPEDYVDALVGIALEFRIPFRVLRNTDGRLYLEWEVSILPRALCLPRFGCPQKPQRFPQSSIFA